MEIKDHIGLIKSRCDNATEGPWFTKPVQLEDGSLLMDTYVDNQSPGITNQILDNHEFVSTARTYTPRLLRALEDCLKVMQSSSAVDRPVDYPVIQNHIKKILGGEID